MPTRKRTTTVVEEPEEEVIPAPILATADEVLQASERDSLLALMSELSGTTSARVTVYRATRNKPKAYCFACSPEAFSLDELREKWNGGEFRLYVSKNGKPYKNLSVNVEPRESAEALASPMTDVAIAMREGFEQQTALLREAIAARDPMMGGGLDINALLVALPGIISAFKSMVPAPAPALPDASERAVDMLLKGIELANDLRGGGEEGLGGVLRDLVRSPMLAAAVTAMQSPQPAPVPRIAAPVGTRPAMIATPSGPMPVNGAAPMSVPLAPAPMKTHLPYLNLLIARAREDSDPALYADVILDNVPEEAIRAFLSRPPSAIDALIADNAAVQPYRAWFELLITTLEEALTAPDNEEPRGGDNFGHIVDNFGHPAQDSRDASAYSRDATGKPPPSVPR